MTTKVPATLRACRKRRNRIRAIMAVAKRECDVLRAKGMQSLMWATRYSDARDELKRIDAIIREWERIEAEDQAA